MNDREKLENLRAAIRSACDRLMFDEDNDNPCGARARDDRPDEFCNPCSVRRDLLHDLADSADNARPEFDGEAPHANDCPTRHHGAAPCECRPALGLCSACGLRDATPGRADGMCSECACCEPTTEGDSE